MAKSYALTEAMSKLIASHPFFAVLLTQLTTVVENEGLPSPAATDGRNIYVKPSQFKDWSVDERVFVLAHECLHVIYQHIPRGKEWMDKGIGPDFKPYSHKKMNQATDYVINATLTESNIGTMPVGGLHNPRFTSADQAEEVYCQLPDDDDNDQPDQGFDQHDYDNADNTNTPSDAEVKQALSAAANAAKAQGNLPAGLERLVGDIMDPKQDWKEQLRDFVQTTVGTGERTWKRPNKRKLVAPPHVYMPGQQGTRTGNLAVVIDTSGSISNEELTAFLSESAAILAETTPERMTVFWTDMEVAGIDEVDDVEELINLTPKGGGGTDMEAAFPEVDAHYEHEVTACIVLTDGYTSYNEDNAPDYPVLWVQTQDQVAPYGRNINLEI
jgi:predicted metal-dependent peptidase